MAILEAAPMSRWTMEDVRALRVRQKLSAPEVREIAREPRQKFGNRKVIIDNVVFDSKKEGEHYLHLKMRERLGEIAHLELQPAFELLVQNPAGEEASIGTYHADFRYWEHTATGDGDVLRVVDVKSKFTKTEAYQRTKKHVERRYGVTILEV
jgi:uncharacterized protein DUF1064